MEEGSQRQEGPKPELQGVYGEEEDQGPITPTLLPSRLPDAGLKPTVHMVQPAGVTQGPQSPPASPSQYGAR